MKPLVASWWLHKAPRGFANLLPSLSKNTSVFNVKWCIHVNLNTDDIIYALVHTYRVVYIHTYVVLTFILS